MSSIALLWFGVVADEEGRFPFNNNKLLELCGHKPDDVEEHDEDEILDAKEDPDGCSYEGPRWAWEVRAKLAEFDCELVEHCSDECLMYGIALRGTKETAMRGNPDFIPVQHFRTKPRAAYAKVRKACEAVGWELENFGQVGWQLAAYSG